MNNTTNPKQHDIQKLHLSYIRYIQIRNMRDGFFYERMFYNILLNGTRIPGIVIDVTYEPMPNKYEFTMYKRGDHVATAYTYAEDLNEFVSRGYTVGSTTNGAINASLIYMPTTATTGITTTTNGLTIAAKNIAAGTISTNTINPKDKIMNFSEYDADTIDSMIDTLLQKKAELDAIESRWRKDEDFNNGDVVVVEYAYSDDEDAKVYTGALLKTQVGWYTTLTNNLLGTNKYFQIVRFFEKIYVKKVTYLALSEGVEMFSNVDKSDDLLDDEPPF